MPVELTSKGSLHDLMRCFIDGGTNLYTARMDELHNKSKSQADTAPIDFWDGYYIVSLYLFRHAIELGLKAYLLESSDEDFRGHDIKEILKRIHPNEEDFIPEIKKALVVLEKFHLIENEQLIRYSHKFSSKAPSISLNELEAITTGELEILQAAAWLLWTKCLLVRHVKNGHPL